MIVISDTTPIISLLIANHLDLLLMDEHKGRNVAKQLNVRYIGTVGILMLAYDKGLIWSSEVKLCLDMILANGIRLDNKLCDVMLAHVGL